MNAGQPVVLVLGPTASGKTDLSIELARTLPGGGECIAADSMQVYRGMDIGTAKPTREQQADVPHHLIDITDPATDGFTVDAWLDAAERAIGDIRGRGRWPIIVGGTNLYIQAFLYGLVEGPAPDAALRAELEALPPAQLRAQLERVDPVAAERIHPNDRRRSIRAIEVASVSGSKLSSMQTHWPGAPGAGGRGDGTRIRADVISIGLEAPVAWLNGRINARVRAMFEAGFVEEVRRLAAGTLGRQAGEALGYKSILDHLAGRITLEEAMEDTKIRSRRYAKQQRTWLRRFRNLPRSLWINPAVHSSQDMIQQALAHASSALSGGLDDSGQSKVGS